MNMLQGKTYEDVGGALATAAPNLPAVTRDQAQRIATAIYRKFWPDATNKRRMAGYQFPESSVRRVWISPKPTHPHNHDKGLGRLVHDLSHRIFDAAYPHKRNHDPLHARYEADIAEWVAARMPRWFKATKPKAEKPKLAKEELRRLKLARLEVNLKRWESKRRRADKAVQKIKRQQRGLLRALGDLEAAEYVR